MKTYLEWIMRKAMVVFARAVEHLEGQSMPNRMSCQSDCRSVNRCLDLSTYVYKMCIAVCPEASDSASVPPMAGNHNHRQLQTDP